MRTRLRMYWRKIQILFLRDSRWVWSFFFVYLGLLFTFAVLGDRGLVQSYRLWKKRGELKQQIEATSVKLDELEKTLAAHQKSDRMLEKVAREQFNMSRSNEHIFIFRAAKE